MTGLLLLLLAELPQWWLGYFYLMEEEGDAQLYEFLESEILQLEQGTEVSNFSLIFIVSGRISTKIIFAPRNANALAVETNV